MTLRRTQLKRGTKPLARRGELRRTGDIRRPAVLAATDASSARRADTRPVKHRGQHRKETGFPAAIRLLIRTRAGNGDPDQACCEACGMWLGTLAGEVQHIVARGMGGSKRRSRPSNGCLLCGYAVLGTGCHGLCERRDGRMREMGFWRKSGDPRVPLMLHGEQSGLLVWPDDEGNYRDAQGGILTAPERAA